MAIYCLGKHFSAPLVASIKIAAFSFSFLRDCYIIAANQADNFSSTSILLKRSAIIKRVINLCKKVFSKHSNKKAKTSKVTKVVSTLEQPIVLSRSQHPVSRQLLSPSALKVLYRLNKGGYDAYLVGGGVRDILLGLKPKDFAVFIVHEYADWAFDEVISSPASFFQTKISGTRAGWGLLQ